MAIKTEREIVLYRIEGSCGARTTMMELLYAMNKQCFSILHEKKMQYTVRDSYLRAVAAPVDL